MKLLKNVFACLLTLPLPTYASLPKKINHFKCSKVVPSISGSNIKIEIEIHRGNAKTTYHFEARLPNASRSTLPLSQNDADIFLEKLDGCFSEEMREIVYKALIQKQFSPTKI